MHCLEALQQAPLRHSPRIGYLSSCYPTQELVGRYGIGKHKKDIGSFVEDHVC